MRYFCLFIIAIALLPAAAAPLFASGLDAFSSDGCSLFPDGGIGNPAQWCECCFVHDIAYWRGGTGEDRRQADEELRACVFKLTGDRVLAKIMYDGVRAGGHPVFPTWYRWGYGWKYGRGYTPLTGEEWLHVAENLDRYFKDHPEGYCPRRTK